MVLLTTTKTSKSTSSFKTSPLGPTDPTSRKFPIIKDELPKGAPFYDISELHMIPTMDDDLYDLFSPNSTASTIYMRARH